MKNFIICISIAFVLILSASCKKVLDAQDDGRISFDVIFSNQYKIAAYYNTCYSTIVGPSLGTAAYSDEAQDAAFYTNAGIRAWYFGTITASNHSGNPFGGDPWGTIYSYIRKCNVFLKNIHKETAGLLDEQKQGYIAEMHALRAYYYWHLAKRYGGVPLFDEALGADHDYSADKRATFSETVRFILADCEKALQGPDTQLGYPWGYYDRMKGRINKATVCAIMSEAATYVVSPLWNDGTISNAEATAINGRALSLLLANGYELFKTTDAASQNAYGYYFITRDDTRAVDKETIYRGAGQLNMWGGNGLPTTSGQTGAGPCPSQNMIDSYEMAASGEPVILGYSDADKLLPILNPGSGYDPQNPYDGRDPRFYSSIYYNGALRYLHQPNGKRIETYVGGLEGIREENFRYSPTGYYMRKYSHYASLNNSNSDGTMRMFRLAEVYLNFAETANQSHGADVKVNIGTGLQMSAVDAVNTVRNRAGMPDFPVGMSKPDFEKKYRNERRVELAFEGHRGFDLRRWKILSQEEKVITGMKIVKTANTFEYNRFKFQDRVNISDKMLIFPINLTDLYKIRENTGANWQNPGWDY